MLELPCYRVRCHSSHNPRLHFYQERENETTKENLIIDNLKKKEKKQLITANA